jgi:hypothetical protein
LTAFPVAASQNARLVRVQLSSTYMNYHWRITMNRTGSSSLAILLSFTLLSSTLCLPAMAQSDPNLNFKIYNPEATTTDAAGLAGAPSAAAPAAAAPAADSANNYFSVPMTPSLKTETPQLDDATAATQEPAPTAAAAAAAGVDATPASEAGGKTLEGYIRVVPVGTKIPIIMDTAVDTDTSQEGDEFAARTGEDLNIDGTTVVPAGSIIKGRLAQLNGPRALNRSGSVALKFDTVTTPDNRQIPIVANLVARGGVVHARRGMKDILIDSGTMALPVAIGLGIGYVATSGTGKKTTGTDGSSTVKGGLTRGGGALIGAGVGAAIGIAILMSKKGKKVDVRPGDELKIELAEDLRMPTM